MKFQGKFPNQRNKVIILLTDSNQKDIDIYSAM